MTVIPCETLTPQCSLCRHFIRHSVDGPGELSIPQPYWLILETKKSCWGLWLIWGIRLDAKPIIHGVSESLLTSQVFFRSLHRYVAEQKLNLLQLAP
jgi:hypothetical protein